MTGKDDVESVAILARAAERARGGRLDYAGAVTPNEAWHLVRHAGARLVDVRTPAELKYVGRVPGADLVEWPTGDPAAAERFVAALRDRADRGQVLLMMCRSGARSHAAATAAAAAGYPQAFNVLEGFEGKLDASRHRNAVEGWRFRGLPWEQE